MPRKRITMQDIADACGLSRNTVSKVFNGRGAVPQATRELIVRKAEELGYGLPVGGEVIRNPAAVRTIALLTSNMPVDYHFGTAFITTFTNQICREGYTLKIFEISPEELQARRLPPHFVPDQTAGIIGIELFDADYLAMVCGLWIPTVVIDSPPHAVTEQMLCDFVSVDNISGIISLVRRLAGLGAARIGFVGDRERCGKQRREWQDVPAASC